MRTCLTWRDRTYIEPLEALARSIDDSADAPVVCDDSLVAPGLRAVVNTGPFVDRCAPKRVTAATRQQFVARGRPPPRAERR